MSGTRASDSPSALKAGREAHSGFISKQASSSGEKESKSKPWLVAIATLVLMIATYAIARSGLYTPGSNVGYYLGLSGSLMMLALLFYPLRKRIPWLSSMGRLNRWFSAHMVLGVAGPILILLHCTLRWRSMNAAVAFWCMVIVASSGLVGRFLYSRLHQGLYGRQLSLSEVRTDAASASEKAKRALQTGRDDRAQAQMHRFAEASALVSSQGWKRPIALMSLGFKAKRAEAQCLRLRDAAVRLNPLAPESLAIEAVVDYIRAARRSAQFIPFERMFALWHVLHIPLVFIMVLSVIAHIIAVHMY